MSIERGVPGSSSDGRGRKLLKIKMYISNIQGRGGSKIPQLEARTHDADFIVLNELNTHPGDQKSVSLNCRAVALTDGGEHDKKLGYGTAVMSKAFNPESDKISHTSTSCEISAIRRYVGVDTYMSVIGMYCSPNESTEKVDVFFNELELVIDTAVEASDDIIIVGGDPNANIGTRRFKMLEKIRLKYNGFRVIQSPTRGANQPDHVVAFYDPAKFTISGMVVDGVGDHMAMIIDINSSNILAKREIWCKKRIVVDRGNNEVIAEELAIRFSTYNEYLLDSLSPIQSNIDILAERFVRTIQKVREENCTYRTLFLPEHRNKRTRCRKTRQVQYYLNKVWTATKLLAKDPKNRGLRENLVRKKDAYTEICSVAAKANIEKNIRKMRRYGSVDTSQFFKATGMHLRFDGVAAMRSVSDIDADLDAAELNYIRKGPIFDLSKLEGLFQGPSAFEIKTDKEFILKRVRGLNKVDPFFKTHADELAGPLSVLLEFMKRSRKFPTPCKVANLVLIPPPTNRTIFYLDFLPKLLEDVVDISLREALPPETEGQMAYIKNRSGNLCVAIGLDQVELCDQVVINTEWDQTKAFDSAQWEAICIEYERLIGAGEFMWDYLNDRTYKYIYDVNGKTRYGFQDQPMGCGTWPGTIIGPGVFSTFQSTNTAMRKSNPVWLWTGKFSDDCSPLAKWDEFTNGNVQLQLDSIWDWSVRTHIGFHLTGKKRPFYYIFRKDCETFNNQCWDADLKFNTTQFDRGYEKRQLGVSVKLFRDTEQPNKYGYILEWKGKKPLSNLSYRLQEMRYIWSPEFIRTCVQAYVVGKLQFASALYWLRASDASIRRARFDYCMAMAAAVGCNTPEIVGMFNCKTCRVSSNCKNYQELCKFLDLPTLEMMAIKDARSLIKQWFIYDRPRFNYIERPLLTKPDDFIVSNDEKTFKITSVVGPPGSLLDDIFNLAAKELKVFYPEYHRAKNSGTYKEMTEDEQFAIAPDWFKEISLATKETKSIWKELGLGEPVETDIMNTYWLVCKDKFKVLERYYRLRKHLDVTPPPAPLRSKRDLDDANSEVRPPDEKRKCIEHLGCLNKTPIRRAVMKSDVAKCWICGYSVTQKKFVSFECCSNDKISHTLCWRNQTTKSTRVACSNVRHYFKRGSRIPDYNVILESMEAMPRQKLSSAQVTRAKLEQVEPDMYCSVCDSMVDVTDPHARDHLKRSCQSIPTLPLNEGYSHPEFVRRMAALGTRKKVTVKPSTSLSLSHKPSLDPGHIANAGGGSSL